MKLHSHILWILPVVTSLSLKPFSPNTYWPGDNIALSVNKLASAKHDTTYNFYDLPFICQPRDGVERATLSMDEILRGDRAFASDFELKMLDNEACHVLCTKNVDKEGIRKAYELVRKEYKQEWYIDGLPGATSFTSHDKTHKYYSSGFRLGSVAENGLTYLNNHFTFVIKYRHSDNHDATRVVLAFEVYPRSIHMTENDRRSVDRRYPGSCEIDALETVDATPSLSLVNADRSVRDSMNITYTYSVYFREELEIYWTNRWDSYFQYSDTRIVWYSTALSAVICILLTSIVGFILWRTLSSELAPSATPFKSELDHANEKTSGWKTLRHDVTRPPSKPDILASLVAVGMQLDIALIALLIRSKLSSSLGLFLLLFSAVFSGHYGSLLYKNFEQDNWQRLGILTAFIVPGYLFGLVVVLNVFLWIQGLSSIPCTVLFELLGIWFGCSLPLVMIGAYTGSRAPRLHQPPDHVKLVARDVPTQPIFTRFWPSLLIAGALPYAAICVELYFMLQASQLHQPGYLSFVFRSLTLAFIVAVITNVEVTVTMIYLQLNYEDHQWHWRSFLYGTASAAYIFAHAAFYFLTRLQYGFFSGIIYFGYTSLFCILYAFMQGMLSYVVTSIFVTKIYSSIKAD